MEKRVCLGGVLGNQRSQLAVHVGLCRLSALVVAVCLLYQAEGVIGACPDTCTCNGGAVLSCAIPTGTTFLYWSNSQLTSIASGLFDGLPGLKTLGLDSNQIATLPSGIFDKLTALTYLQLGSNRIATLPSGIFDKLTALTYLSLYSNQIATLPSGIFDKLTALTYLRLDSNQNVTLPSGIFDKLTALTILDLYSNQIATLPSGIFDKLTALTSIRLSSNRIATLPSGLFDKLTALTILDISSNQIATLLSGMFDKVTALTSIDISSNQIATLPSGIFDKLTALTSIRLYSNRIATLPSGLFDKLIALNSLSLYSNQIATLPSGIFDKLTALTSIDISSNQIATLPSGIFDNLTALTSLLLPSNRITTLPSGIFDKLTALTILSLYSNQIATLPSGIFDKLTALTSLLLPSNRIATLPSGIFDKLTALTILSLYSNQIATLPSGIFDKLAALAMLDISSNRIATLPSGIFDKLIALNSLSLSSNQIATLPSGIFDKLPTLYYLGIKSNPGNRSSLCLNSASHCVAKTCAACFCEVGWTGLTCSSICPLGTYGSDCAMSCACQNGVEACDRFSGVCDCTVAGWTGVKCDQACASGRFGPNCTQPCTCKNVAACDRFTGDCTVGASSSGDVAGPVAGGVVGAIVGAAGIVFAILFVRKRMSRKKMEALARSELDLIDTVVRRPEITEIEILGSCIHLHNRIGEGEFGEVYLADITPRGGSAVIRAAVKTFKVTSLSSVDEIRSARSAFMAEIDLMRTIPNHANIIELIGVCTQSDPNCMVLEFAAHGDLRHFLTNSKVTDFTAMDLLCFCIDIARGMEHLAKCEIVHRDLAARNCMVVAGPRAPNALENGWKLSPKAQVIVKVADMGLSRDTGATDYYAAKTRRKLPVKWMAPESLQKRIFTHASDVWSFGIVMWEVFARGAKPYPGLENHAVSTYLSQNKRMGPPKDCPNLAYAAMEACWRKHAETRPQLSQLVLQLRRGMTVLCGTERGGGGANATDSSAALEKSETYALIVPEGVYAETVKDAAEDGSLHTLQNPIFQQR